MPETRWAALRARLPPALGVAFACFVGLGLNDSTLGTAWPSIRHSLALPIGDLGLVQVAATTGFLTASAVSGRVTARLGRARGLACAGLVGCCGLATLATSPVLGALLAGGLLIGLAGGTFEPGMQAHVALTAGPRAMNLLHAFYGVGATLGPLLLSGLLLLGVSWRLDYLLLVLAYGVITLGVARRRRSFDATTQRRGDREAIPEHGAGPVPRAALASALLLFFFYCGVEMCTGQWAFTFFTAQRHLGTGLAGLLVSGYWGSLTLARLGAAALGHRISPDSLLTASAAGAVGGELLLWWNPVPAAGAVGLLLVGASLAPAFPLMMSKTAEWAGTARVSTMIGWQSAAAGVGIALPSALAGLIVESFGLSALPPYLVGLGAAFLALQLGALRFQARAAGRLEKLAARAPRPRWRAS